MYVPLVYPEQLELFLSKCGRFQGYLLSWINRAGGSQKVSGDTRKSWRKALLSGREVLSEA
jgi:hypothetical protein